MTQDLPPSDLPQATDDKDARLKARDPLVGTVLDGRFQIEEVLGSGGMSIVYKATQLRVNRHVAIKTLRLQLDTKEIYRERFQREISSLCTLNHPNIVTVYDCIIGTDDQPYIVMDYLRGRSLEALIEDEGPMSVERFARISIQMCSALEHAHKRGIIHRDLKPGNVVLMDDEMDFVKVVDFGLAKIGDQNKRLTHSGELWGSPPYMSPEQCMGEAQDQRSDLYSLGAVMFEMLTGVDPYPNATTVFEFIKFHTSVPPPAMSVANAKVNVPQKVEDVVRRALEKDPSKRYQTAKELQDAIVEASSASVDREKGEFLFHLANQASSKTPSGQSLPHAQQVEQSDVPVSASAMFRRALNPFADEETSLDGYSSDSGQGSDSGQASDSGAENYSGQDAQSQTEDGSFTPSVQRWRTPGEPGTPSRPHSEIVRPTGEIVKPPGEIVPPPGVPIKASTASLPSAPAIRGNLPNPSDLSQPGVSVDGPKSSNTPMVVALVLLVIIACALVPRFLVFSGQRTKYEPPRATTPAVDPIESTGETRPPVGETDQAARSQSSKDKIAPKDVAKSPDEAATLKTHLRHPRAAARAQARAARQAAAAAGGAASARPAPAGHAASPPSHAGSKADPWSALEKMR